MIFLLMAGALMSPLHRARADSSDTLSLKSPDDYEDLISRLWEIEDRAYTDSWIRPTGGAMAGFTLGGKNDSTTLVGPTVGLRLSFFSLIRGFDVSYKHIERSVAQLTMLRDYHLPQLKSLLALEKEEVERAIRNTKTTIDAVCNETTPKPAACTEPPKADTAVKGTEAAHDESEAGIFVRRLRERITRLKSMKALLCKTESGVNEAEKRSEKLLWVAQRRQFSSGFSFLGGLHVEASIAYLLQLGNARIDTKAGGATALIGVGYAVGGIGASVGYFATQFQDLGISAQLSVEL